MSENQNERDAKRLKDQYLEKEAKRLKEQAEEEQRRKDEEAAEEERKRRAAAEAAAERARQAAATAREQTVAATQQKNKLKPKPQIHKMPNVVFSPKISPLKPPTPGAILRPEPNFIKKFRDNLEGNKKRSIHYDPEKGQLTFTGAKGFDALIRFLEENPNIKITLEVDRDILKDVLRELKHHKSGNGTLLDKLSAIEMDGRLIQEGEIQKVIGKFRPPKPSPTR